MFVTIILAAAVCFSQAFTVPTKNASVKSVFLESTSSRESTHLFSATASSSGLFVNIEDGTKGFDNLNSLLSSGVSTDSKMHPIKSKITKAAMLTYIASMCIALPATLYPIKLLHNTKVITKLQKEQLSCRVGCFCSRWLMRIIPFANVKVVTSDAIKDKPEPTIWVCNHTSMLDIFFLLAKDKKLRGKNKRPIKIIYWKDLEKNPITRILFTMSGFIPVEMEDNGNGNANHYKKSSFKALLKSIKEAFDEGFDIGILPEGQLNPLPEKGLQPVFGGAFTLSKMSKRPIKMMAIHGLHQLWHGDDKIGMNVTGRKVTMRNYNVGGNFSNSDQFVDSFKTVVGHFGATGKDHPAWEDWMTGLANNSQVKAISS